MVIGDDIQSFNYLHRRGLQKRQKKLWLSGSLCGVLCLPCVRGGGPRSGERDLQVRGACLQASPIRVRKPRSGWRVVKKQSLSRLAPTAPFTQGSLKNLHILPDN